MKCRWNAAFYNEGATGRKHTGCSAAAKSTCEQRNRREHDEPTLLICAASETLAGLGDQDTACCASAGARACGEMEKKGSSGGWCGKMKRNPYDGGLFYERDTSVNSKR